MSTTATPLVQGGGALQAQGMALLAALHATAQALRLYPLENATVQKALDELSLVASRIAEREESVELRLVGDFLFLNDARLRLDLSNYVTFSFLTTALARHGIGTVTVEKGVTRDEWAPFISLLLREEAGDGSAFQQFQQRFQASPVRHIRVEEETGAAQLPKDDDEARESAKRTYAQSVQVAREVLTDIRLGKAVNVRRVKRAVQAIVDQVLTNENSIVGMTVLRNYDEYTFTHSVNVCIFSVVLGQKLGLSKIQLYELGLGALFHDIGKMRIDSAVIAKPAALTDEEIAQIQEHPTEGLLALFSTHGLGEVPYRAMLITYEHHMRVDLSGYPRNRRPRRPTLFSRLVAIADAFDAATSKRTYQAMPWTPAEVLREMRDNPARGYDPLLVKAFINVTGVYPIGTLAILDTYELAVVVQPNPDPKRLSQPIVKIIADPMGIPLSQPITADLSEVDPSTGHYRRTIIKTTDPEKYGINIGDYFV